MLRSAAYHGHLEFIKLLISNSADVKRGDPALLATAHGAQAEAT